MVICPRCHGLLSGAVASPCSVPPPSWLKAAATALVCEPVCPETLGTPPAHRPRLVLPVLSLSCCFELGEAFPEAQGHVEVKGGTVGGCSGPGGLRAELHCWSRLCPPREKSQGGLGIFCKLRVPALCQARLAFPLLSLLLKKHTTARETQARPQGPVPSQVTQWGGWGCRRPAQNGLWDRPDWPGLGSCAARLDSKCPQGRSQWGAGLLPPGLPQPAVPLQSTDHLLGAEAARE